MPNQLGKQSPNNDLVSNEVFPGLLDSDVAYHVDCVPKIETSLLLCCRQVYQEAKHLPFELNTFGIRIEDLSIFKVPTDWSLWSRLQNVNIEAEIRSLKAFSQFLHNVTERKLTIKDLNIDIFLLHMGHRALAARELEKLRVYRRAEVPILGLGRSQLQDTEKLKGNLTSSIAKMTCE